MLPLSESVLLLWLAARRSMGSRP